VDRDIALRAAGVLPPKSWVGRYAERRRT